MREKAHAIGIVLLGTLVLTAGCTTHKRHKQDITNLQDQIGTLQSEVSRLDQSLRQTEMTLQAIKEQGGAPSSAGSILKGLGQAVYRTPSGFELPVVAIQRALKNAGYYSGEIDGKVGSWTRDAIRNFQRDQGLEVDGVCGRQTWARLKAFG